MIEYQEHAAPDDRIRAMNVRDRGICLYLSERWADAVAELQARLPAACCRCAPGSRPCPPLPGAAPAEQRAPSRGKGALGR